MAGDRDRKLDEIRATSDRLTELGRRFDRLRWMAEKDEATDAFVDVVIAAGELTESGLAQTANLLDLLRRAGQDS